MNKENILSELKISFDKCKKEIGFKTSFEEIEEIFYIKDCILKDKFIGEKFSRQLCKHITELFISWNNYLHNLVFPNPGYIIGMMESKIFDDKEKKWISNLMSEAMVLVSMNILIELNHIFIASQ